MTLFMSDRPVVLIGAVGASLEPRLRWDDMLGLNRDV
jgi:hypothetical protein